MTRPWMTPAVVGSKWLTGEGGGDSRLISG
jgi:hypothetical protein